MGSFARRIFASPPSTADEGHWEGWRGDSAGLGRYLTNLLQGVTATGRTVTPDDAVSIPAVYRGLFLLASLPAFLPLKVYRAREGGGSDPARDHYAFRPLYHQPNPWQTSFQWRVAMGMSIHLRGNGYSSLIWGSDGTLERIHWIHPDRVEVYIDPDGYPVYKVWPHPLKRDPNDAVWLSRWEMHHVWTETLNGYTGCTAIEKCRESVALALGQREIAAKLMANGAMPSGLLTLPAGMNPETMAATKLSWEQAHKGLGNSRRTAVVPSDVKYQPLSLTMEDAQWIEASRMSKEEMATMLGIPPDFLVISAGQMGGVTGVEQRFLSFLATRLDPILVAWEQALQRDVIDPEDLDVIYPRFTRAAMLRTDILTRFRVYGIGRQWGLMNADECRALEEWNPIGGEAGTSYLTPSNMAPLQSDPTSHLDQPANAASVEDPESYAPLLEQTLTRVYRRAIQDLPGAERRGDLAGWDTEHRRYSAEQLMPVVSVLPGDLAQPLALLTPDTARGADPVQLAHAETCRLLGTAAD